METRCDQLHNSERTSTHIWFPPNSIWSISFFLSAFESEPHRTPLQAEEKVMQEASPGMRTHIAAHKQYSVHRRRSRSGVVIAQAQPSGKGGAVCLCVFLLLVIRTKLRDEMGGG